MPTDALCTPEEALRAIAQAFDGVPPPGPDSRTLAQAEAWDSYRTCGRAGSHLGRWQDLPAAELQDNPWALPHLDAAGLHYYLPAIMTHSLVTPEAEQGWIHESLIYTLSPQENDHRLRSYQRERLARLTLAQRAAILGFLQAAGQPSDLCAAWQRAVDAGSAPDWYERFNPAPHR